MRLIARSILHQQRRQLPALAAIRHASVESPRKALEVGYLKRTGKNDNITKSPPPTSEAIDLIRKRGSRETELEWTVPHA
jgi:hypothetical protein